jgi:hypothetical protein
MGFTRRPVKTRLALGASMCLQDVAGDQAHLQQCNTGWGAQAHLSSSILMSADIALGPLDRKAWHSAPMHIRILALNILAFLYVCPCCALLCPCRYTSGCHWAYPPVVST